MGGGVGGGGGSGFLKYQNVALEAGLNVISARVGAGQQACLGAVQQASTLGINGVFMTALYGRDGNGLYGGNGYSGGGATGFAQGYNGGSNGSDGESYKQYDGEGSGTGEDVSKYIFTAWNLTPGAGGFNLTTEDYHAYGGGGGGVLVDGAGPEASLYQGKGFGGGGGGPTNTSQHGLQGVILLEVRRKK